MKGYNNQFGYLSFKVFKYFWVKCNPAVGAATEPSSWHRLSGTVRIAAFRFSFNIRWQWNSTGIMNTSAKLSSGGAMITQ